MSLLQVIGMQLLMNLLGMAMQIGFWATSAYWVARMARRGWRAGSK